MIKTGFFGKLPPFADFIRYNANMTAGLDEWLQAGINIGAAKLGNQWRSVFATSPPKQFVILEGDTYLAGAWIASRDESGRLFPFILFAAVGKESVGDYTLLLKASDLASDAILEVSSCVDGEDMVERTRTLEEACNRLDRSDCFRNVRQEIFWAKIFGDFEDRRKFFLYQQIKEVLAPFSGMALDKLKLGLKLPIPDSLPESHLIAAAFWCGLYQSFLRNSNFVPNMVWEKNKAVFLFPVKMQAHFFLSVIKDDYLNDNIYAPLSDGISMIDEVIDRMSSGSKNALNNSALNLSDLLSV